MTIFYRSTNHRRLLTLAVGLLAIVTLFTACPSPAGSDPTPTLTPASDAVTGIDLTGVVATMTVGDIVEFNAEVTTTGNASKDFVVSSSDETMVKAEKNGSKITVSALKVGIADITATAGEKSKKVTITVNAASTDKVAKPSFDPAAGTFNASQSVTISCATADVEIRYTIDGTTEPSATTGTVYSGSAISVATTTTIKAIAVKTGMTNSDVATATFTINIGATIYNITFNVDGGSSVSGTTVANGEKITTPTSPTKTGYTFNGWYKVGLINLWDFAVDTVTSDTTLFAKWTINTYTISFDSQSATTAASPTSKTATYNGNIGTLPTDPVKTGYTFGGWYTGTNGSGTAFDATTAVTSSIPVYAKWTINTYTISFDSQSATTAASPTSKTASYNGNIGSLPSDPVKTGYTFGGWYTGTNGSGTAFDASTAVTASIPVYAKWTINTYTISFDSQSATTAASPTSKTATYNGNIGTLPTDPVKTGYTFGGWYTGTNGSGTAFDATTAVTSSIPVYAKWISMGTLIQKWVTGSWTDITSATAYPGTTNGSLLLKRGSTWYQVVGTTIQYWNSAWIDNVQSSALPGMITSGATLLTDGTSWYQVVGTTIQKWVTGSWTDVISATAYPGSITSGATLLTNGTYWYQVVGTTIQKWVTGAWTDVVSATAYPGSITSGATLLTDGTYWYQVVGTTIQKWVTGAWTDVISATAYPGSITSGKKLIYYTNWYQY